MNLTPFKKLLVQSCGHTFEKEREQALATALERRMSALGIDMLEAYHSLLLRDEDELLKLIELLTVNETYFFREPDHLNLLVEKLLPEFVESRSKGLVRILSAGCSTGEEPYSLAIMLRERFGADSDRLFTITGVDIDSTVIEAAKKGIYGIGSFRGMDDSTLKRYFKPTGEGRYCVSDAIKKYVSFEVVNLLGASYPEKMLSPDVILYRNVSIYFPSQIQRAIFEKLAALLTQGGCLLVGASETLHHDIGILSLVKQDSLFFYRKIPKIIFEERRSSNRYLPPSETHYNATGQTSHIKASRSAIERNHLRIKERHNDLDNLKEPDVKDLFDKAVALAQDKEYEKANAILDAIIEQDDSFIKAYCLKGSLLLGMSRFDEANAICENILKRDQLSLVAYLMLGMIARHKQDDDLAIRRFREAIYLDPSCWLAHFYSAEIMFAQQDTKRARSSYEAAVRVLEKGTLKELGQAFFPLTFNAEQFIVICRHKLSILTLKKG